MYMFAVLPSILVLGAGARVGQVVFARLGSSLAHAGRENIAVEIGPGANARPSMLSDDMAA
jgi:hypothetical protein